MFPAIPLCSILFSIFIPFNFVLSLLELNSTPHYLKLHHSSFLCTPHIQTLLTLIPNNPPTHILTHTHIHKQLCIHRNISSIYKPTNLSPPPPPPLFSFLNFILEEFFFHFILTYLFRKYYYLFTFNWKRRKINYTLSTDIF